MTANLIITLFSCRGHGIYGVMETRLKYNKSKRQSQTTNIQHPVTMIIKFVLNKLYVCWQKLDDTYSDIAQPQNVEVKRQSTIPTHNRGHHTTSQNTSTLGLNLSPPEIPGRTPNQDPKKGMQPENEQPFWTYSLCKAHVNVYQQLCLTVSGFLYPRP